jgi:hypothetical protein
MEWMAIRGKVMIGRVVMLRMITEENLRRDCRHSVLVGKTHLRRCGLRISLLV